MPLVPLIAGLHEALACKATVQEAVEVEVVTSDLTETRDKEPDSTSDGERERESLSNMSSP